MKKTLLLIAALSNLIAASAQSIVEITYSPNVQEFVNNCGPFMTKDVYKINENKLSLEVNIFTDFVSHKKIGYVMYTSEDAGENVAKAFLSDAPLSYYTSSLDTDELPLVIQCLEFAQENMLESKPDGNITYFFYDTKLGGRIGVKRKNNAPWEAFFNADPLERSEFERTFPLSGRSIDKVINAFKRAYDLILEKTGEPLSLDALELKTEN